MAWVQPVFSCIFLISSPKIGTSHVCNVLAALPSRVVSPVFSRRGCRSCSSSEPCTPGLSSLTACWSRVAQGASHTLHHGVLLQTPWACRKLPGARWKMSARGLYRRRRCREWLKCVIVHKLIKTKVGEGLLSMEMFLFFLYLKIFSVSVVGWKKETRFWH